VRRRRVVGALLVVAVAACGSGSDATVPDARGTTTTTTVTAPAHTRPYDVSVTTETFVDSSRPTVGPGGVELAPGRTLVTDVYVPDGPGPFPLVVHAHGLDGNRTKFTQLLTAWAEAGYAVAAPTFPLTSNESDPVVVVDHEQQPADLSFVVDEVLALLGDTVDATRIGASGLSLGSSAAYGVGYHPCCRDERVDAVMIMDGMRFPLPGGDYPLAGIPLSLSHFRGDGSLPYSEALDAFGAATGERYLLTLDGTGHAEPYEDSPSRFDDVVEAVTTDFWDLALLGDDTALDRMRADADVEGLASLLD
jgi:dienelactone hydrolase